MCIQKFLQINIKKQVNLLTASAQEIPSANNIHLAESN